MRNRFCAVLSLLFSSGCINYSSYQDARIVERGHSSGTFAATASKYQSKNDYDEDAFDWYVLDMNPRFGLGSVFDAGFRMSVLFSNDDLGWVVLGGDVRAGIIKNYLAATLPVNIALAGNAVETTNLQPGFIVTIPIVEQLDVNGSVRKAFYLQDTDASWWLYNAGLGIKVSQGWRLRPEVGWMVPAVSYDHSYYMQFGVGITNEH